MVSKNDRVDNIKMSDARIIFRNFSGKESRFNKAGSRNFCVVLDEELAKTLKADGWNVKEGRRNDDFDEPLRYLQVSVGFDYYPPKVYLIAGNAKNLLTEETINTLDWADIEHVDLTIRPYIWEVNGKTGIKAYLKNMYVTVEDNEFDRKYGVDNQPFIDDDDTPF